MATLQLQRFEKAEQVVGTLGQPLEFAHIIVEPRWQMVWDGVAFTHEVSQGAKQSGFNFGPLGTRMERTSSTAVSRSILKVTNRRNSRLVGAHRVQAFELGFDLRPQPAVVASGANQVELARSDSANFKIGQ